MTQQKRVIAINDNPEFLELLQDFLSDEGYEVITLQHHQGAFEQVKASQPHIVICDLLFGGIPQGWALIDMLFLDPETRNIPIILCSAATKDIREAHPSLSSKGIVWLEKPFELDQLLAALDEIGTKRLPPAPQASGSKKRRTRTKS